MNDLFFKRGERVIGPFSIESLREAARVGKIRSTDCLSKTDHGPWVPVVDFPGLLPSDPVETTQSENAEQVHKEDFSPTTAEALEDDLGNRVIARSWAILKRRPVWQLGLLMSPPTLLLLLLVMPYFSSESSSGTEDEVQVVEIDPEAQQKINDLNQLLEKLQNDLDVALEDNQEKEPLPPAIKPDPPVALEEDEPPAVQEKVVAPAVLPAVDPIPVKPAPPELKDLVARIEPGIVRIDVTGIEEGRHLGSGFLIDQAGVVVTNFHVIEGAKSAFVTFADGTKSQVVGFFTAIPDRDLALLKIANVPDGAIALPIVEENSPPEKGERIVAFGTPKGLNFSVSDGLVGGLRSGQEVKDSMAKGIFEMFGLALNSRWVQHSAGTTHGNSGGPIVNLEGAVVGVHALGLPDAGGKLNFAVDARELHQHLPANGALVQELAQLPQPRKKIGQVNPRPMFPPGWVNLGAWLAKRDRLDAIMQQRVILFRARDAVRGRKDYAIREANSRRGNLIILQNQLRELVGKNRRDKNSYDNTKRAFVAAQQQLGFANREEAFAIEREIQGIQAIGLRIEQVLDANARAGRQLEVRFGVEQRALDSAESQYNTALSEENGLVSQANGLRMEWLTIINPFDTIAREDFQLALQQCGEWVALDGDFFGSYWLRGAVHARMGNFGPAHADMRRAIQLSAGYPPLLAEMNAFHGWVYLLEKRYSTARKVLAASTKLHKQCQTARLVCGMLDLDVGRFQSARSEFRAAVNLGPKNLVANYYYARIMAMCPLKRYRAGPLAVKHAEIACAASNWKGPECLFLLANSHFEAGNEQEAFAWYGQAIKNARHEGQAQWYMFCLEQVKMGKAIRLPLKF